MIFVTTGSQKFQFNRLLREVDELVEKKVIRESVFAQIGYSDYRPANYAYTDFLNQQEFVEKLIGCDMVITHGGTGVIIRAVKNGKKVIAVPRLVKFGEHVDDHQIQLLSQFEGMNLICACYDISTLGNCILSAKEHMFGHYVSNTQNIIRDIEDFIDGSVS